MALKVELADAATPTTLESFLPSIRKALLYQCVQRVLFNFGAVTRFFTPLVILDIMLKISVLPALARSDSAPCHIPRAITTKSADMLAEMTSLTGLRLLDQLPPWLL
jgi:hypothetical protein